MNIYGAGLFLKILARTCRNFKIEKNFTHVRRRKFPNSAAPVAPSPLEKQDRSLGQGELTIIGQDGKTKVVHEGEAVVEMVGTIHHGENRGTKPVILYMFYLSQKDLPLAVQHPDIPLE